MTSLLLRLSERKRSIYHHERVTKLLQEMANDSLQAGDVHVNKVITRIMMTIWVVGATVMLARFWLLHHYLFPQIPESFAIWLTDLYGARNAEEVADMETLLALSVALVIVGALTFLARWLWRRFHPLLLRPEQSG